MNENIVLFEASMMLPGQIERLSPETFFMKEDAREYLETLFDTHERFRLEGWVGVIEVANEEVDFQPEYVYSKCYMIPPRTDWQKEGF